MLSPYEISTKKKYDALIVPGGFGVAKNLCDFALKGEDYSVFNEFQNVMEAFALAKKTRWLHVYSTNITTQSIQKHKVHHW